MTDGAFHPPGAPLTRAGGMRRTFREKQRVDRAPITFERFRTERRESVVPASPLAIERGDQSLALQRLQRRVDRSVPKTHSPFRASRHTLDQLDAKGRPARERCEQSSAARDHGIHVPQAGLSSNVEVVQVAFEERTVSMNAPLTIWTIYERPLDYPQGYVVRRFLIGGSVRCEKCLADVPHGTPAEPCPNADRVAQLAPDLRRARALVPPGKVRQARSPGDDPAILEVWL